MSQQRDNPLPVMLPRPRHQQLHGGAICAAAPAKINLDLLVGPRRADGYHPLDSVVAKVSLYDEITLTPRDDGQITLACRNVDCGPAEMNLAYRAAQLLTEHAGKAGRVGGVDITLVKHIPPGKGLGGGSSDAAAVLAGLDQLWRLATPADRLAELAATLGSDVPLFLGPPAARMTGRGEKLHPVAMHGFAAVLHMPDFTCATADVYHAFDRLASAGAASAAGALTGALPTSQACAGRPMARREQIDLAATPPSAWRGRLANDLTAAAQAVNEPLRRTLELLRRCAAAPVHMTGSGSAMFIICDTVAEAQAVARRLPPDMPGQTVIVLPNPW